MMFYLSFKAAVKRKYIQKSWRRKRNFETFFKPFLSEEKVNGGNRKSFKFFISLPTAALHLAFDSGWM